MNITLEVKVDGIVRNNSNVSYTVVWLDWDQFKITPGSRQNTARVLVSNGYQAFTILRGKKRITFLEEHGYDPNASYVPDEADSREVGPSTQMSGYPT
jgi:hypothetical protein